jgi:hypothetical protein
MLRYLHANILHILKPRMYEYIRKYPPSPWGKRNISQYHLEARYKKEGTEKQET